MFRASIEISKVQFKDKVKLYEFNSSAFRILEFVFRYTSKTASLDLTMSIEMLRNIAIEGVYRVKQNGLVANTMSPSVKDDNKMVFYVLRCKLIT